MKKKIGLFVSIGFIILIAILALLKEPTTYDLLKYRWKYTKITDTLGNNTQTIPNNNFLVLSPEFTFTDTLLSNGIAYSGFWRYTNKQIIQTVNYDKEIDSLSYTVNGNIPIIQLYKNGDVVSTITNGGIENSKFIRSYDVVKCTETALTLQQGNKRYELVNVGPAVVQAPIEAEAGLGFSFMAIMRGLFGMVILIIIAYLFSSNRKGISWAVVGKGLLIQLVLAFSILKIGFVAAFFELIGKMFVKILDFTKDGSVFLLGDLMNVESYGFIFAFQVLPTIIFFSALTSVLFYLGIIQKVVYVLAWLMTKAMKLSGAESLSVAGNIFLGQTESPLLIKAYLEKMNRSEILLVMAGGMATLAGGVLAAYIAFLGGDDPVQRLFYAKHLLTASIMAAPGVVVIAKILVPQDQEINQEVEVTQDKIGSNVLDAISNGTTEGIKLAVNVAGMLLVFIAMIALVNFVLDKVGYWTGANSWLADISNGQYTQLNLQSILGYVFAPLVWLLGVASEDITYVGRVVGEKLIMTEFIGYVSLAELKEAGAFAQEKSIVMATYMLCGFANFASIGIQIGGIGSLAPGKRVLLSEFGMRALLAGTLASLLSATIVGMILG